MGRRREDRKVLTPEP